MFVLACFRLTWGRTAGLLVVGIAHTEPGDRSRKRWVSALEAPVVVDSCWILGVYRGPAVPVRCEPTRLLGGAC